MRHQPALKDSDLLDGLSVRHLKIFGLWSVINDQRTTGKKNWVIKFVIFGAFIISLPYTIFQVMCYFYIPMDLPKFTIMTLHLIPGLQMLCQLFIFWFRLRDLSKLCDLMRKDFLAVVSDIEREAVKKIYIGVTRRSNLICVVPFVVNTSVSVLSTAFPAFPVDYIDHRTGIMPAANGGRLKISGAWYPVPMGQAPYYEIIFIYETIIFFMCSSLLAVYVCFFYQTLMCLCAQFAVLSYYISTLKAEIIDVRVKKEYGNDKHAAMYKALHAILKDHNKLLSYANELRSIYNPLVTLVLGLGIIVLIVAVFLSLFGGMGSLAFAFRWLLYLTYQCVEVCIFCYGSSNIEEESSDLQFAIYSSDWYKADTKFRKAAQMMMLRARKGETLTALKMYPVNMETIMAILQFTYSVATLMSKMTE